jgi:hypothetical protein
MLNYRHKISGTILLLAMINGSVVRPAEQKVERYLNQDALVNKVFPKMSIIACGWTGLSAASFVGKKIYKNWANLSPKDKEHYNKVARRYQRVSRFSAIPLVSLGLSLLGHKTCETMGKECPQPLQTASQIIAIPGFAMTAVPAALTTPDLYTEKRIVAE